MAYGTPASLDDVEAYYTHIRGGSRPSKEQLENLVGRYKAVGGASPLLKITTSVAERLQGKLRERGSTTRVYAGMKHSPPFIGEVVGRACEDGVDEMLCIALAPHYSSISIGLYMKAVEEAASSVGRLRVEFVRSWHDNSEFISLWTARIRDALPSAGEDPWLIFTAHSLPERILQHGDPYREQLLASAELIARKLGWNECGFAFQSPSQTGEKWLGPDILEYLQTLYDGGRRNFLIAPIGFVSDHLEILYDIDVECMAWAREHGAKVTRCESPNASDEFISCLVSLVSEKGFV